MPTIPLAIVGCGGMGHRHMYGLAELQNAGLSPFSLVAVYDPVRASAESLADQAADRLGTRPVIADSLDQLASHGVAAIDLTTTPRFHHSVAVEALNHGWHMMVEKPFGLTVRACNIIRNATERTGRIVAVAENYRRDPINRLARALLDAGAIGVPRFAMQHTLGGSDQMLISVWRHQKDQSGVLIDVGVHYTDMLEYLLGPIVSVYAHARLHEPVRHNPASSSATTIKPGATTNPGGVYTRWQRDMPPSFEATAEDAAYALFTFASGAVAQYIEDHAAHGLPQWRREIYGSTGSLVLPDDRTGQPLRLHRGTHETIEGDALLDLVPDFALDPATATLFGGERLGSYDLTFPEIDRKLLAVEYADFGDAINNGHTPEVDAMQGTRAVAAAYAMLESNLLGHAVSIDDMLAEKINGYQQEIDAGMGI